MRPSRARLHPIEIRAHVVPRQVQHLAPELPVFLDLCLGLRRPPSELAVRLASLHDPPHCRLKPRVLQIQMHSQLSAQIRVPVGDHVDPLDRRDCFHVLQPLERLDRRAKNDILVCPRRVLLRMAATVRLVSRVRPLSRNAAVPDRWIFRQAHDGPSLLGGFDLGHLDAHDALVQDAGDQMREILVDAHDGGDVGGLEPARQIGDRFHVERPVLVVDGAIVEAGRLNDPRHPARGEFFQPSAQRRPPLAHRPPYRVLFHGRVPSALSHYRKRTTLTEPTFLP